MKTLIQIRDLNIGHKERILFNSVSFDIREGECIMLCGANGSGKTTLMKTIAAGADGISYAEGCVTVMIPSRIPKVKGFTIKEFVRISCYNQSDMGGRLSKDQEELLEDALERMGLKHLADRDISTLSDGEFQKAGIASALGRKAAVIMLDEPTAFLDAQNRISVLATLKDICTSNRPGMLTGARIPAVIFSTHDLHDGLQACSKVFAIGADGSFNISTEDTPESKSAAVASIFR